MSKLDKFKDTLIYEAQKEFYDERGKGARYRMTRVGVSYFKSEVKDLGDLAAVGKWLKENGFCREIQISEDGITLDAAVTNCCLQRIRDQFIEQGRQPLSCPMANLIMHCLEVSGSLPPELTPIEFEGDTCKIKMAKIYTSEVVKG
ncbi:MAG: hypothetical protein QHH10_14365 [Peptococcaceae bacterium]|jgi:hypothetical protein|nr:hypothetical protein [Peptococcaceae bacterium]MDH7526477.1 hypothetical protein [Peptococcaceae bacterium]